MKKPVHVMITAFRDGLQSCLGARVLTDDFLDVVSETVHAGLTHLEVAGGARFQSLYFYCNEDAFTMMDRIRQAAGSEATLQSLSRGVNVVGLDTQPRDIIRLHAQLFAKHGIDVVRNFDALNDVNNLIDSAHCLREAGLKHEVCVAVMELPPGHGGDHPAEFYTDLLRSYLDAGLPFDSVCFKDSTGTLTPATAYETVRSARRLLGNSIKLAFHNHETCGIGALTYRAALEAGVDQIDLSLAPVSGGAAQTDVVVMWHALRGTEFDLGLDIRKVLKVEKLFRERLADYVFPPEAAQVDPLIPFSPVPGGALTANTQLLRDSGMMGRFEEVVEAMGEVVVRGGCGTSVTPVSQFYFQQAFLNVLHGPWKKIGEGYGRMILGYFGKTPLPPDPELVQKAKEQLGLEPTQEPAIDLAERDPNKGTPAAETLLKKHGLELTPENVFIAAVCGDRGLDFLQGKGRVQVRKKTSTYTVSVEGKNFVARVTEAGVEIAGTLYRVTEGAPSAGGPTPQPSPRGNAVLRAALPGLVLRLLVPEGVEFRQGQPVLVIEALKEQHPIPAPGSGRLIRWLVRSGEHVRAGQDLAEWAEG